METSHRSPPPGTCHTEFSLENRYTYPDTGPTMNQEVGGRGQTKGKAKPWGQNCTAMAQLHMPVTIIRWQTADLPINSEY